jgi:hypothetical protein
MGGIHRIITTLFFVLHLFIHLNHVDRYSPAFQEKGTGSCLCFFWQNLIRRYDSLRRVMSLDVSFFFVVLPYLNSPLRGHPGSGVRSISRSNVVQYVVTIDCN